MLASITAEAFEEWWAYYTIEPWGDDWERTGTVAAAVDNSATRMMYARAGENRIPKSKILKPDDYIPKWQR